MSKFERSTLPVAFVLLLCGALGGCSNATMSYAPARKSGLATGTPASLAEQDRAADAGDFETPRSSGGGTAAGPPHVRPLPATAEQRIMVYGASYTLAVADVNGGLLAAEKIASELHGYIGAVANNSIVLRIPAAAYTEATSRIEALGQVTKRFEEAVDVTEEYVDLEARLKNARAVHERLTALLAKAENVEAALAVEKELGRVGEEIEKLEAKLQVMKNRVAYSTITVIFAARQPERAGVVQARLPFHWLRELDPYRLLGQWPGETIP